MGDAADRFQPPVRPKVCAHPPPLGWHVDTVRCPTCGQCWEMDYDPAGRRRGWVPVGRAGAVSPSTRGPLP